MSYGTEDQFNATTNLQGSRLLYLTPDGDQAVGINSFIDASSNAIVGLILLQDLLNPPNQLRTTINNTGIEQNDASGNITIDVSWENLKNLKLATPALRLPATSNIFVVNDTYEANDNNLAKTRKATLSAVSATDPTLELEDITSGEKATLTQDTLTYLSATAGTPVSASWASIISATAGSATTIAITDTNTSATYYPTFVDSSGSSITLRADIGTTPFSINPNIGDMRFGTSLKLDPTNNNVAIGSSAGLTSQGTNSVAIGRTTATTSQGNNSVAIGNACANNNQGANSVAIGNSAGNNTQGSACVAIGNMAGQGTTSGQGVNAIAIGKNAGVASQTAGSICLNASGVALNPSTAGCYINPIRAGVAGSTFVPALPPTALYYDTTTFEILRAT